MENELFWPRVWQMACRLEEIPEPGDFVEYEILDQSIVVVRTVDMGVKAYYNACRHRGVKLVQGRGTCPAGSPARFMAGASGWTGPTRSSTSRICLPSTIAAREDLNLTAVRCELWGGCAWINMDDDAPPLRDCLEPFATVTTPGKWSRCGRNGGWPAGCR